MIDIKPKHLEMVRQILAQEVPEFDVYAFGSRVTGRSWEYSDLDLVIMTEESLSIGQIGSLKDAFSESDLPIKVDVVDWAATSENFKAIIQQKMEIIRKGTHTASKQ